MHEDRRHPLPPSPCWDGAKWTSEIGRLERCRVVGGGAGDRGRRDPFPPSNGGRGRERWSPAPPGVRTRAPGSSGPHPPPPPRLPARPLHASPAPPPPPHAAAVGPVPP